MTHKQTHPLRGADRLIEPGIVGQMWLAWKLLRDPRVTGMKYLLPALLALYVGSPVDAIPDLLLGIGQVDDVGVVILGVLVIIRLLPMLAPKEVVAEYVRGRERGGDAAPRAAEVVDAQFTVRG
jgi:uncharacterized membrane protein YkvA (DUF1232 family)